MGLERFPIVLVGVADRPGCLQCALPLLWLPLTWVERRVGVHVGEATHSFSVPPIPLLINPLRTHQLGRRWLSSS